MEKVNAHYSFLITCRENPDRSKCLGVFGLSLYTTERELEKEFGRYRTAYSSRKSQYRQCTWQSSQLIL
jgi:hypothetical protein